MTMASKLAATKSFLKRARSFLRDARIPILSDLLTARWPNWRESLKEVFVTLFFSLMPLWLGLLIVNLLTLTDGTSGFIAKFASSSDLGILSASLLGPLLYMMFREDGQARDNRIIPGFPSGLWFIMITVASCIVATVIYCFTYVSGIQKYHDAWGVAVSFVRPETVGAISWFLFFVVVSLILCASTIRNSMETQPARMMSSDTQDYVAELEAAQNDDTESYVEQLQAAQEGDHAASA